jgi:2-polyprenyl-3-methyl-5-hydroxy-6-metoxy-1,4-benzoquinol methylase
MTDLTRPCPVCQADANQATLFLENSIDPAQLSGFSFASRKAPEFMSHRLVRCKECDLVYADQPPGADELARAYHQADYDSSDEANDAAAAYILAAQAALAQLRQRQRALEIGTGTGIFLDCLKTEGFAELVGIEPSSAAIREAPAHRRSWIREGVFEETDFQPESFDLVCCFMTLEHVRDPRVITEAAMRLLRPGGVFIAVTHDYRSLVNRLLGKRSPIIDVEHMQLFSAASVHQLMQGSGYQGITVNAFVNRYRSSYWPTGLKKGISKVLRVLGLDGIKLSINVGNLFVSGFKRE